MSEWQDHEDVDLAISAKIDTLKSMREYFMDLYGHHPLGFDIRKVKMETLVSWHKTHVKFYDEATLLMGECIERGYVFDPEDIRKLRDYHFQKAQTLAAQIAKKGAADKSTAPSA